MKSRDITLNSSPEEVLSVLKNSSEQFDSDVTTILARDAAGKLMSVAVYATGDEAKFLERYLKARARAHTNESLAQGVRPDAAGGKP